MNRKLKPICEKEDLKMDPLPVISTTLVDCKTRINIDDEIARFRQVRQRAERHRRRISTARKRLPLGQINHEAPPSSRNIV